MRVAWVHPTWRDLVIERLAGDAELRRRFLRRCGPHGIVLALSTGGGAAGERRLPLICGDEDWDAVGDGIYAVVPELEHAELVAVLSAVRLALRELAHVPAETGEARTLARMTLERTASVWQASNAPVSLDCVDAWLMLATQFHPPVRPDFLATTWAELLPVHLPDPGDLAEVQRFTDWATLCELVATSSPEMLDELGYGAPQRELMRAFRDLRRQRRDALAQTGASPVPEWDTGESPTQRMSDHTIRRVLADL